MASTSCGSCAFFSRFTDPADEGKCKRFPPTPVFIPSKDHDGYDTSEVVWLQPEVDERDTCGEWREV